MTILLPAFRVLKQRIGIDLTDRLAEFCQTNVINQAAKRRPINLAVGATD